MKVILGQISRDRAGLIKLIVIGLISLLFAVGFQTSFFPTHRLFGAIPDLTLTAVFLISCFYGSEVGAIAGIAGGFLLDCFGVSGIFILPLAYFTVGWFFGVSAKSAGADSSVLQYLILLLPLLLFRGGVTAVLTVIANGIGVLPNTILKVIFPEMLATGLFAVLLYFPARLVFKKRTHPVRTTF